MSPPRARRLARYRPLALAGWCAGFATLVVSTGGIPLERTTVLVCIVTFLAAVTLGRESLLRLLADFVPLTLVLVAYGYLRGISDSMGTHASWRLAPDFDRDVFGLQPVVWLQQHLVYATPRWWDVPVTFSYCSFFLAPWIMAGVFWTRDRRAFYRWTSRWVAMSFAGFLVFALAPTAPPWAAARCRPGQVTNGPTDPLCLHRLPAEPGRTILGALHDPHAGVAPTAARISWRGFDELHIGVARSLLQAGEAGTDLVAAVPSLHAAGALMITLFLWRRVRRGWRVLLAAYPPAMGIALVYTANHYVFDVLTGWVLTGVIWFASRAVEAAWARERDVPVQPRDASSVLG